jgi:hypothetical protein
VLLPSRRGYCPCARGVVEPLLPLLSSLFSSLLVLFFPYSSPSPFLLVPLLLSSRSSSELSTLLSFHPSLSSQELSTINPPFTSLHYSITIKCHHINVVFKGKCESLLSIADGPTSRVEGGRALPRGSQKARRFRHSAFDQLD